MVARPAQRLGPTWASGGGRAHFRSAQGARAQGARWGGIFKPLFSLAHRGLRCFRCARLGYLWVVTALQQPPAASSSPPAQLRLQHGALGAQRGSARGSVVIPSLSINILCYTVNLPSWYVEGGGGG